MNVGTLQSNTKTSSVRRTIIRRLESPRLMSRMFSPIERWEDENYAPRELNIWWNKTPEFYQIIAPIEGFKASDVHVDLCRDHIIILLSHTEGGDSALQEYYREVEVPADARKNVAWVEIDKEFLTVTLRTKETNPFKRLLGFLSQSRRGSGLLTGRGWKLEHLEEVELP
jgi:HSP20 family molecular chaperone IbpA